MTLAVKDQSGRVLYAGTRLDRALEIALVCDRGGIVTTIYIGGRV